MNNNKSLTIEEVFKLAVKNHQEGKTDIAQEHYNQVLKIDPNHSQALNNIGIIFKGLGENQKAKDCYEKAIKINADYGDAHNNRGNIFKILGENQKAKECYEKAIKIDPNHSQALNNIGVIFKGLGENPKAKECYEKAIKINPNYVNAHNNLGIIFQELGENQKAKDCYEKAIKINADYADAHNNLGIIFQGLGETQKAKECYKKAIKIDPNHSQALNNIGVIFQVLGENQKAKDCFEKAVEINPDFIDAIENISQMYCSELNLEKATSSSYKALKIYCDKLTFTNLKISLNRLKHDVQQAKYLSSNNYEVEGLDQFQKVGDQILSRKENKKEENDYDKKVLLTANEVDTLLPFFRSYQIYKPKIISGSCINPNKNWQEVEDEYFNSSNQIMYIDDFLSEEALIELREFCLVSKVWNKEYDNKYLGAFSSGGFISPIHLQIAKDLKEKLPKLFGAHDLAQFWGFKYDSALGKGINIHADAAIHNLNFWITPDEYNNNKNGGGLKVYDVPAPDNWTFKDYNNDNKKIYKFLEDNNAKCTNIPYRFNRAVLFNSAYFHETDEINFKDEYEGRRINCTYLFGRRVVK